MPVRWTPENDRLLLLKLVETHGISINADAIVSAWPSGPGDKPTPRAITERFVRLRQLTGVDTPRKARVFQPKTPSTSTKKRKIGVNDTESDADEHLTKEDTPTTKGRSAGRGRATFGSVTKKLGTRIKQEPGSSVLADMNNPFDIDGYGSDMPDQSFAGAGVGTSGAMHLDDFYGTHDTTGNISELHSTVPFFGNVGMGPQLQNPFGMLQTNFQSFMNQYSDNSTTVLPSDPQPARGSATPSNRVNSRARSVRKASKQASEELAEWSRQEKVENGGNTSEEDSGVSDYQEAEGEWV